MASKLRLINALSRCSLDAPLVAVVWLALLARMSGAAVSAAHYLLLFASVWLGYTADRLLDARRLREDRPAPQRHHFHRLYERGLRRLWVLVLVLAVTLACFTLEAYDWFACLMMLALVFSHLFSVQALARLGHSALHKELSTALVFTLGTGLFAWLAPGADPLSLAIGLLLLCALALCNQLQIACRELSLDSAQASLGLGRHARLLERLAWLTPLLLALFALSLAFTAHARLGLAALLCLLGLRLLERLRLQQDEAYRSWADLCLCFPLLPLLA